MTTYSLLILAGGQGRRMNGANKALVHYQGKPLIEHVIERACLPGETPPLFISANRDIDQFHRWTPHVVPDTTPGEGPVAGLSASLPGITTPVLALLPCDTPLLPPALPRQLTDALVQMHTRMVIACDSQRPHFLCAALHLTPEVRHQIQRFFEHGGRRMQDLANQIGYQPVFFKTRPTENFSNLNTQQDIQKAQT